MYNCWDRSFYLVMSIHCTKRICYNCIVREIEIHVYAKQQTYICTTWRCFPLIFRLLIIASTQKEVKFYASFNHRNCSALFLFAYFLSSEIVNLNLMFAFCSKREHQISLLNCAEIKLLIVLFYTFQVQQFVYTK